RVRASRITYVGELGWELYVPTEFVAGVYDTIVAAGEPFGLTHAGYHALDSLRIEKAYRHWGHDITDEDTPLEAGLGFTLKFDKPGGFIGREALLRDKAAPPAKQLLQFRLLDPVPLLYHNEPIWRDDDLVGHVTSGAYGHTLGGAIGLGYVDTAKAPDPAEGDFRIEVAGKRIPAEVSSIPMYDPKNKRIRR
ncbi:MAG: aminomethyltransferase family protein, partial [Gammaproteobacteria bacterium]|nr:aminomethyltransferase family protein [Gammaproteobacteria bacterium]